MSELLPELLHNASLPEAVSKTSKPGSHSVGSIIECIAHISVAILQSYPTPSPKEWSTCWDTKI